MDTEAIKEEALRRIERVLVTWGDRALGPMPGSPELVREEVASSFDLRDPRQREQCEEMVEALLRELDARDSRRRRGVLRKKLEELRRQWWLYLAAAVTFFPLMAFVALEGMDPLWHVLVVLLLPVVIALFYFKLMASPEGRFVEGRDLFGGRTRVGSGSAAANRSATLRLDALIVQRLERVLAMRPDPALPDDPDLRKLAADALWGDPKIRVETFPSLLEQTLFALRSEESSRRRTTLREEFAALRRRWMWWNGLSFALLSLVVYVGISAESMVLKVGVAVVFVILAYIALLRWSSVPSTSFLRTLEPDPPAEEETPEIPWNDLALLCLGAAVPALLVLAFEAPRWVGFLLVDGWLALFAMMKVWALSQRVNP